ncbi:DUF6894 family protein [Methylobacterium nigriterrae]|uniref:DUF6894 family protein n=1 Tax=Methylobacterium nigriterrae TaxID=3127512 RepID=UPI003013C2D0
MARYFFDFITSSLSTHDDEGSDCSDRSAISEKALSALCEIAADHPQRYMNQDLRIDVRNKTDQIVMSASLRLSTHWLVASEHIEAA